jgi:hypothetical protein
MSSPIAAWQAGTTYTAGTIVTHNGGVYQKADDGDNTEPDAIAGGWSVLENSNVAEFNAIATSFSTYEERVRKHKADTLAKLHAAGLDVDAVKAVLTAD